MEKLVKQALKAVLPKAFEKLPKNLVPKLVALFFAVFLWYFVVGEDKVDTTIYVPIEIINLPQNLVISNQFKRQLEVTVNGPRGLVRSVTNQNITRPVNLANIQPGSHVIQNKADSINFPSGILVQNIRPANVTLIIDMLLKKELAIKPVLQGNPATGYEVGSILSNPPTLSLSAPAAVIGEEVFLPTKPIDISDRKSNLQVQTPLDVREEITELIGEPVINVNIQIKEKLLPRDFNGIPVEFRHEAERTTYRLDHHQVDVTAELPYSLAGNDAQSFHFEALLEAGSLAPGSYDLPVKIVSDPPGLKILKVSPPKIKLNISPPTPALKLMLYPAPTGTKPPVEKMNP